MSTRSRIGIVCDDGKVASIYCHWDGYPDCVGDILLKNYSDKAKVEKLIALGSISSLREEVDIPEGKKHTFDRPLDNVVIAYMRDRGDTGCEPRIDEGEKDFWKSDIEEWGYLFKDGKWFFATSHGYYGEDGQYKSVPADKRKVYELTDENITEHRAD